MLNHVSDATEATAADQTDEEEGGEERVYDLALALKERARGFAALMRFASEHGGGFDMDEERGIARLALDIADDAEHVFECARRDSLAPLIKDGRFVAYVAVMAVEARALSPSAGAVLAMTYDRAAIMRAAHAARLSRPLDWKRFKPHADARSLHAAPPDDNGAMRLPCDLQKEAVR